MSPSPSQDRMVVSSWQCGAVLSAPLLMVAPVGASPSLSAGTEPAVVVVELAAAEPVEPSVEPSAEPAGA